MKAAKNANGGNLFPAGELSRALAAGGVAPGETAVVHCALRCSGEEQNALLSELLGFFRPGTLVMPAGKGPAGTPTGSGTLTEKFLAQPGVVLSRHAFAPLAALGQAAAALLAGHELCPSPFSPASPWWRLFNSGGKLLFLGCGLECSGLLAAAEEWTGAAVFGRRPVLCPVPGAEGKTRLLRVKRHTGNHYRNYPRAEEELFRRGLLVRVPWAGGMMLIADIPGTVLFLMPLLRRKPRLFAARRRSVCLKKVF